jgi:hypothetical protein
LPDPQSPQPAKPVALTNASMPQAPTVEKPVNPRDPWEGVEAKPLTAPAFDQIKRKNPNIEIRWVNRSVSGSATPHLRYEQMLAMGWVPATPVDVEAPPGCLKDGHIQIYDVILMKIDRVKYLGAMRYNNERVNKAVRRPGQTAHASEMLNKAFAEEGVLGKARGKVSVFVPGDKEIKQMSE